MVKREIAERTEAHPFNTASTYQRYEPEGSARVMEVTSSVSAICTNGAPSSETKTRKSSVSGTALQTKVTGELTFCALSAGATSSGAVMLQRGVAGTLNVSLFEKMRGQPSKMLSTNQVTVAPGGKGCSSST